MANASTVAAATWLDVWERAAGAAPVARASLMLSPCIEPDAGRALTVGARDTLLLDLRGRLFGHRLRSTATCPACHERCEWDCDIDAMRAQPGETGNTEALEIVDGDWRIRARAVRASDLESIMHHEEEATAVRALLARCVIEARRGDERVDVTQLPEPWIERLSATLAAVDPQAAATVALTCPACAHAWDAGFDIGEYLWIELDAWAQRTLADVHELALRYGWSEPEILALSPARRGRYLAMADA